MSIEADLQQFSKCYKEFIKPYHVQAYGQNPTFVCIDANCKERGLICAQELTIHGAHRNHDAIEINKFMEHCLRAFSKDFKKDELSDLIRRIDEAYEELLKILTDFHESYSTIIKSYISKKNELHTEKESLLFT